MYTMYMVQQAQATLTQKARTSALNGSAFLINQFHLIDRDQDSTSIL